MTDRLTPKQAAKIMGVTDKLINYQMDIGNWDLGLVSKSRTGRNTHIIFRAKLEKLIGRQIGENEL